MLFPVVLLLINYFTAISGQSVNSYIKCDPYSLTNTDSANQNYQLCQIDNVCPGLKLSIGDCSSSCTGDQFIRLFDGANAVQLAGNDDGACESPLNLCSSMDYTYNGASCVSMVLRQGCYDTTACSGRIKVNYIYTSVPSYAPSAVPTFAPSSRPSATPTFSPSAAVVLGALDTACAPYTSSNTDKARSNFAVCNFQLCPGTVLTVGNCGASCSGDQFIRLFDGSNNLVMYDDDGCAGDPYALCSQLTYVYRSGVCQTFSLHQGCYGAESCGGTMSITKATTASPTALPTDVPTAKPSSDPSAKPTALPTFPPTSKPTSEPTFRPSALPTNSPSSKPTADPTYAPSAKPTSIPTFAPTLMPYTGFSATNINDLTAVQQSMWYRSKYIGVVYTFNDCTFNLADDAACAARYPGADIVTLTINGLPAKFAMTADRRAPTATPTVTPTAIPSSFKPTTLPTNAPILSTFNVVTGHTCCHADNWVAAPVSCIETCALMYGGTSTNYHCSTSNSVLNSQAAYRTAGNGLCTVYADNYKYGTSTSCGTAGCYITADGGYCPGNQGLLNWCWRNY